MLSHTLSGAISEQIYKKEMCNIVKRFEKDREVFR